MYPIKLTENRRRLPARTSRNPQAVQAAENVYNRNQQNQAQTTPQPQASVSTRPLPSAPGPQQLTPQPQATMSATPLTSPQFNQPNNIQNPPASVQNSNPAPTQPQVQPQSQAQSLTSANTPNIRPAPLPNPQTQNASVNTNTDNTTPNTNRFENLQQFGNNIANSGIANHFKNNLGFYGVAAGAIGAGLLLRRILNRTKNRQQRAAYDAEGCGSITHPVERKKCMDHVTSNAVRDLQNSKSYCNNVSRNERANCVQQIDQQIQELLATSARQNQNLF